MAYLLLAKRSGLFNPAAGLACWQVLGVCCHHMCGLQDFDTAHQCRWHCVFSFWLLRLVTTVAGVGKKWCIFVQAITTRPVCYILLAAAAAVCVLSCLTRQT